MENPRIVNPMIEDCCTPTCPAVNLEIWVDCYHGRYEVSNYGRVRNSETFRVLKAGIQSKGYRTVNLYDGSSPKKPKSRCVHSLVMTAFVGPVPVGFQINHKNGDKSDNTIWNLEYCTPQQNMRHAVDFLGQCLGEKNPNSKLSDFQVASIRVAPDSVTNAELSVKYGVSTSYIRRLRKG